MEMRPFVSLKRFQLATRRRTNPNLSSPRKKYLIFADCMRIYCVVDILCLTRLLAGGASVQLNSKGHSTQHQQIETGLRHWHCRVLANDLILGVYTHLPLVIFTTISDGSRFISRRHKQQIRQRNSWIWSGGTALFIPATNRSGRTLRLHTTAARGLPTKGRFNNSQYKSSVRSKSLNCEKFHWYKPETNAWIRFWIRLCGIGTSSGLSDSPRYSQVILNHTGVSSQVMPRHLKLLAYFHSYELTNHFRWLVA